MGVKHTVHLTRDQAVEKYVELEIQVNVRRKLRAIALAMDPTELEEELETLNDRANDGEGFENYIIRDEERKEN